MLTDGPLFSLKASWTGTTASSVPFKCGTNLMSVGRRWSRRNRFTLSLRARLAAWDSVVVISIVVVIVGILVTFVIFLSSVFSGNFIIFIYKINVL